MSTDTEPLPEKMTISEAYGPAMAIRTQEEADAYFNRLVDRQMRYSGKSREEAEQIERSNLGYFAGYYNHETNERVQRLFRCQHPVFGSANNFPTPEKALEMGKALGESIRTKGA